MGQFQQIVLFHQDNKIRDTQCSVMRRSLKNVADDLQKVQNQGFDNAKRFHEKCLVSIQCI